MIYLFFDNDQNVFKTILKKYSVTMCQILRRRDFLEVINNNNNNNINSNNNNKYFSREPTSKVGALQ